MMLCLDPEWRMVGTLVPILLSWMKAVTDFLLNSDFHLLHALFPVGYFLQGKELVSQDVTIHYYSFFFYHILIYFCGCVSVCMCVRHA